MLVHGDLEKPAMSTKSERFDSRPTIAAFTRKRQLREVLEVHFTQNIQALLTF